MTRSSNVPCFHRAENPIYSRLDSIAFYFQINGFLNAYPENKRAASNSVGRNLFRKDDGGSKRLERSISARSSDLHTTRHRNDCLRNTLSSHAPDTTEPANKVHTLPCLYSRRRHTEGEPIKLEPLRDLTPCCRRSAELDKLVNIIYIIYSNTYFSLSCYNFDDFVLFKRYASNDPLVQTGDVR